MWEAQDILESLPNDKRTVNLLASAKNSIMPFLEFTGDLARDFTDNRLATLDCSIFVKDNKFFFFL